MPQEEWIIRVVLPFAEQELSYKTLDDCVLGLAGAFELPGFSEAEIGAHRLEVYQVVNDKKTLRQTYYSQFITDEQLEKLQFTATK